jgi:predicted MFS family arabinose efflux permease
LKLILTEDTSLLGGSMKASTLKLCLPVIILSTQHAVVTFIIPPFLESLKYPLSAIGSLISVGPILALCARLPAGLIYKGERARSLLAGTLLIIVISNFLYGFAVKPLYFALVHALNGFALGAATTIYLAFYVESLPGWRKSASRYGLLRRRSCGRVFVRKFYGRFRRGSVGSHSDL